MKKILQLVIVFSALSVALLGCGGGGGGASGGGDTPGLDPFINPAAKYAGSYSGTFSGSPFHFNAWSMNVVGVGTISGHTNNDLTGGDFSGTIDSNGIFHLVQSGGTGGDVTLDGTVDASGNVTGTWVNVGTSTQAAGAFSGSKETIPAPRFIVRNGTIYDSVSNLTWLQNADCFGVLGGIAAKDKASALANGQCGLSDNSLAGAWRLPTISELVIFVDDGYFSSSLITTGFLNVRTDLPYWSSSPNLFNVNDAWDINMSNGFVAFSNLGSTNYVWPVRTGQ